jgi:hypothetical protein
MHAQCAYLIAYYNMKLVTISHPSLAMTLSNRPRSCQPHYITSPTNPTQPTYIHTHAPALTLTPAGDPSLKS